MIIAELSGEAEMLIRTEGCRNCSQGQRIGDEIILPRGRDTLASKVEGEKICWAYTNKKCKKCRTKSRTITELKIASAIGKMRMAGISVSPPDINKSTFTFSPDVENSTIRYGMSGIV